MPFPQASTSDQGIAPAANEERLRLATEAAGIGTYDWDLTTGAETCSKTWEEIFGLEPGSFIRDSKAFLRLIHPDDCEFFRQSFDACQREKLQPDIEFRIITPAEELRWIGARFRILGEEGEPVRLVGVASDITDRKRNENRLAAQYSLARVLAESESLAAATPGILHAICTSLEWDAGAIWAVDRESASLRCLDIWQSSSAPDSAFAALMRETPICRGAGLPGRVWDSGAPEWVSDIAGDADFPGAFAAGQQGLRSGFGFPLQLGAEVTGVLGIFSRHTQQPDVEQLRMFTSIGSQIGQVIERIRAEHAVRLSYQAEKQLRERADRAKEQIGRLQSVTSALSNALSSEQVAGIIMTHAVPAMGARAGVVCVLSENRSELQILGTVGYPESAMSEFRTLPVDAPLPISECIRRRELITMSTLEEQHALYPAIAGIPEHRGEAVVAIPMLWKDRAIGAVGLTVADSRAFDADERAFLLNIGQQCAQALERARLYDANLAAEAGAAASLEALQKSETTFRRLVESNVIGVVFGEGTVIRGANQSFLDTVGYTHWDLLTGKLNWTDMTPPGFRHLDERAMEETRRRRAFTPYAKELIRKDGGSVPILVGGASFDTDVSSPWVSFVLDLTEHRAMEQALRKSELCFRTIFDQAPLGIVQADLSGRIVMVNQKYCDLTGYSREELTGQLFHVHTHAEDQAADIQLWERATTSETPAYCQEKRIVCKNGTIVRAQVTVSVVHGEDSAPAYVLGMVEDVTERKQMQERLLHWQKTESLAVLAGGIAHDFNNLLTGIMGNASLAMAAPIPGDVHSMLTDIVEASQKASVLTRQMLAYAGKGRWLIEPIDVSALARQVQQSLPAVLGSNVTVHTELAPDLPPVEGDLSQIQQVLMNLVINAGESIREGKSVDVLIATSLERIGLERHSVNLGESNAAPGLYVALKVQDNGCGMDEETQSKIFDPFFTTKFIGRGLGLAAVAGIVQAHKGFIRVSSRRGEGTTFKVFLPAADREAASSKALASVRQLRGAGTILIVEDDESVRQAARKTLEHYGYRLLLAASGAEAVEIFSRHSGVISLVLLDVTMPVMNGDKVLCALQSVRPDVRVLLCSGYEEIQVAELFPNQSIAFIHKPYTAPQLAAKVKQVMEEKR